MDRQFSYWRLLCLLAAFHSATGCVYVPANSHSQSTNRAYVRYADKGQYDLAIKEIDRKLESPDGTTPVYVLYNDRGEIYRWQGKYEEAVGDYKKALEIKPDFYIAWNNLGLTYTGMKDYEQAITCLNKALEINPTFALTYYNRGLVYERLKENDKAADDFRKAKELGYTRAEDYNGKRTKF